VLCCAVDVPFDPPECLRLHPQLVLRIYGALSRMLCAHGSGNPPGVAGATPSSGMRPILLASPNHDRRRLHRLFIRRAFRPRPALAPFLAPPRLIYAIPPAPRPRRCAPCSVVRRS
jgi:hypothetical protein